MLAHRDGGMRNSTTPSDAGSVDQAFDRDEPLLAVKIRATTFTMSLAAEPRVRRDGDRTAGASEDVRNSHACHAKLRASPSEAKLRGVTSDQF